MCDKRRRIPLYTRPRVLILNSISGQWRRIDLIGSLPSQPSRIFAHPKQKTLYIHLYPSTGGELPTGDDGVVSVSLEDTTDGTLTPEVMARVFSHSKVDPKAYKAGYNNSSSADSKDAVDANKLIRAELKKCTKRIRHDLREAKRWVFSPEDVSQLNGLVDDTSRAAAKKRSLAAMSELEAARSTAEAAAMAMSTSSSDAAAGTGANTTKRLPRMY